LIEFERNYDPLTGRFITEDPAEQLLNPYVFSNNNPVMFADPDGEFFNLIFMAAGAYFGGQAAYNASNGNLFATILGAIGGGYLGYNVGSLADAAMEAMGVRTIFGGNLNIAGQDIAGLGWDDDGNTIAGFGGLVGAIALTQEKQKKEWYAGVQRQEQKYMNYRSWYNVLKHEELASEALGQETLVADAYVGYKKGSPHRHIFFDDGTQFGLWNDEQDIYGEIRHESNQNMSDYKIVHTLKDDNIAREALNQTIRKYPEGSPYFIPGRNCHSAARYFLIKYHEAYYKNKIGEIPW